MKIRYMSDLHLEISRGNFEVPAGDPDEVLVLAGDICSLVDVFRFAECVNQPQFPASQVKIFQDFILDCCKKFRHVFMVLGNHDYWGTVMGQDIGRSTLKYGKWEGKPKNFNVFYGSPRCVTVDDTYFVGCTLWTDVRESDPLILAMAQRYMNDFSKIEMLDDYYDIKPFNPSKWAFHNKLDREELAKSIQLAVDAGAKKIVAITHMAPFEESINREKYSNDPMNFMYANTLLRDRFSGEILRPYNKVNLWIHGHMHDPVDYKIQSRRVVCNPRGYVMEDGIRLSRENPNFDPTITVEI